MKKFIFFARACTWLILFFPPTLSAQDTLSAYPNYVVIGAFAHQGNAVHFTGDANQNNFPAKFEMNPNRNLYYVYVLSTDDREYAFAEALKLRTETKYWDTWVYSGALGDMAPIASGYGSQDVDPLTRGPMVEVRSENKIQEPNRNPGDERVTNTTAGRGNPGTNTARQTLPATQQTTRLTENSNSQGPANHSRKNESSVVTNTSTSDPERRLTASSDRGEINPVVGANRESPSLIDGPDKISQAESDADLPKGDRLVVEGPPPVRATPEPLTKEEVVGKNFYFHLFRADNHKMVAGEVDAIDFEKSRKMATYEANAPVKVMMPSGKTKQISFICQVFGYRKQQKEFDPNMPIEELYLDDKGNIVMPFELVRLQKGDIAIMYNVFFFKDAAVMRPESRYEVNNLLDLLVENPTYKIRIHGHTNGNASGKIIRMNTPGNFYSLSGTKQGVGSAKQLSEERAIVIRDYLVSSGIGADRMEVKAWGGKKPIHDKHSVRAAENVRVEIEILSD